MGVLSLFSHTRRSGLDLGREPSATFACGGASAAVDEMLQNR